MVTTNSLMIMARLPINSHIGKWLFVAVMLITSCSTSIELSVDETTRELLDSIENINEEVSEESAREVVNLLSSDYSNYYLSQNSNPSDQLVADSYLVAELYAARIILGKSKASNKTIEMLSLMNGRTLYSIEESPDYPQFTQINKERDAIKAEINLDTRNFISARNRLTSFVKSSTGNTKKFGAMLLTRLDRYVK